LSKIFAGGRGKGVGIRVGEGDVVGVCVGVCVWIGFFRDPNDMVGDF